MPGALIGFIITLLLCLFARRRRGRRVVVEVLDWALFLLSPQDPFTLRDLLNGGVIILGRPGSGKSSASGKTLMRAVIRYDRSGMLIIAQKPEEKDDVMRLFAEEGREADLIVVEPGGPYRLPLFEYMAQHGADARAITHFILTVGESMHAGDAAGGDESAFFRQMNEVWIYNAVVIVCCVLERVTPVELHRFINSAAMSPAQLGDEAWRANSFHYQCVRDAHAKVKNVSGIEADDVRLAIDGWLGEWPPMADRTRSSILAGINGILHTASTGLVREMMTGGIAVTPDLMFARKSILFNMPVSQYGPAGAFLAAGLRYLTQQAVLRRKADPADCINVIWLDEFQATINSFDYQYLAQCRSHLGCMVCLTQSIPGLTAALKTRSAQSQAEALMATFTTKIFHACDPKTAEFGSASIGRTVTSFYGGSMGPPEDIWDALGLGRSRLTGSFSEHVESILQPAVFMNGLRTGGRVNGYQCDAIVVRSGEPFVASGQNFLKVTFSQR